MIGVFDSGLGGLTIARELIKQLPQYNFIYLGDNARAPYGNKSAGLIFNYTTEALDFLFSKGCSLVILACNTASSEALRKIQQEWLPANFPEKKVLGVVIPVAEEVADLAKVKNKIGIIGTRATIESGAYEREIKKINSGLALISKPTPLLVPLIEEGWINRKETKMILRNYLRPLKNEKIKYLVLGCTHYPFLLKQVKEIMGKTCGIIDSPKIVAIKTIDYLKRHPEVDQKLKKEAKLSFFTTDDPEKFKILGERFLGMEIKKIEKISLNS